MMKDLETMNTIQEQKVRDIELAGLPPLDPEGIAMAEYKRATFDLPTNAVKVDPLR